MTLINIDTNPTDLPSATWRLLCSPPAPGSWNMAVDEAVLEAARDGHVPPTLRLFAWDPPCLTIGYAQEISDVDMVKLNAKGWDIVRRITGGRAILHTDELTYSISGADTEPRLAGDILSSYQRLSSAILSALGHLELSVKALPKEGTSAGQNNEPVCFEVPSNYEITIDAKKLVGSAQARKKGGVLQHGTLPLYGDLTRITQVLVFASEEQRTAAANRLLERGSTVESALGQPVSWETAADAFIKGFSETLNLNFEPGELTPRELARAKELEGTKYSNPEWSENR